MSGPAPPFVRSNVGYQNERTRVCLRRRLQQLRHRSRLDGPAGSRCPTSTLEKGYCCWRYGLVRRHGQSRRAQRTAGLRARRRTRASFWAAVRGCRVIGARGRVRSTRELGTACERTRYEMDTWRGVSRARPPATCRPRADASRAFPSRHRTDRGGIEARFRNSAGTPRPVATSRRLGGNQWRHRQADGRWQHLDLPQHAADARPSGQS